ncbi:MAG: glycoside hydrolase family 43 protein [Bacteroidaceae bacterium]|nr:glycoside hydrolase family 43 protein [Bacteroidaceae bacterium]
MRKLFLFLLAGFLALPIFGQSNVLNDQRTEKGFQNPVIPGYYPDPSVCRVGDDFYLVTSSFQYFPGVPVFHSKDLIHWEQIGNVLDRPSQVDLSKGGASSGIFAPTIRFHEGKYYMITTNINLMFTNKAGNFIVTADNPAGPWSDPVFIEGVMGIDPSLYWENGKMFLVWSAMNHIGFVELDSQTYQMIGEPKNIWDGDGDSSPEGPHLYKKDGYYYLLIAEGGTEMGHKVNIARSSNIDGPYTSNPANPILTQKRRDSASSILQGTGHPDLIQAADGSWWMVYLGFRDTVGKQHHLLGRETCLAPVRWDENAWPVVNGKGWVDVDMSHVQTLPQVLLPQASNKVDFKDGKKLGFEWIYTNNPVLDNYSYANNQLLLKATSVKLDDPTRTPTFVARRQTDVNCVVTTSMSMKNAKAGDRVGLTVYMESRGHYDVALIGAPDGSQQIELSYRLGEIKHVAKTVKLNSKSAVQFRIDVTNSHYAFSYSTDGKEFLPLAKMDSFFLSTETMGGFTGILFGWFAEGEAGTRAVAAIDWMDYQPGSEYKSQSAF